MAQSASRRYVCARQREAGLRVIKRRWLPGCRVVANIASLREIAGYVVRVFSAIEVGEMARNAAGDCDVVVVVDVATGARGGYVEARQRPTGRRVIKLAVGPEHGVMALFARGREARVRYRRRRAVKGRLVARHAGRDRDVVVVIDVAGRARRRDVRTG